MTTLATALVVLPGLVSGPPAIEQGPFVGHVTPDAVSIWARANVPGDYVLSVAESGSRDWVETQATAAAGTNLTMVFTLGGLVAQTAYDYTVAPVGRPGGTVSTFVTVPGPGDPVQVSVAFGSCANDEAGSQLVWDRIGTIGPDVVVLLGDTPYIDSTNLHFQRQRYREFASIDALRQVLSHTPWYGTWDDHDFGKDDTDGNLPGKEFARQAFIEYHANPSYGDGEAGIYTSFRHGPVEVFLLDTRYFAATAPSPVNAGYSTMLGAAQWHWLLRGLQASQATFKVLAAGVIWNKAVRPNKTDHWATYLQERNALFRFIGDAGITGVILVGGDIHRSRVVRHPVAHLAGYELTELITSPMHETILNAANAPHPGLVWDAGEPNSFLVVTADTTQQPATLTATFLNATGDVLHVESLDETDLRPGGD